jgi:hypothetical protein
MTMQNGSSHWVGQSRRLGQQLLLPLTADLTEPFSTGAEARLDLGSEVVSLGRFSALSGQHDLPASCFLHILDAAAQEGVPHG